MAMIYTGNTMYARVGDRLIQQGRPGHGERHGVILEIRGEGGKAPYVVRWDDGRQSWYIPGTSPPTELRASRDR
ncbi:MULTISPECIES: DUF1918 domain-containing protein [unclassified Frankia]|nr:MULTISPECIES: DUF1918 domain-containing protein [unclassified Frankia]